MSEFARRRFLQGAAVGGAALMFDSLWSKQLLAEASPTVTAAVRSASEADLNVLSASHPLAYSIINDLVTHAKYTMTAAAAGVPGTANELADACRALVASRKPKTRAKYAAVSAQLLAAPQATRDQHFGRFAVIAPAAFLGMDRMSAQRAGRATATFADGAGLGTTTAVFAGSLIDDLPDATEDAEAEAAAEAAAAAAKATAAQKAKEAAHAKNVADGKKYTGVEFILTQVKCIQDTDDQIGADEIAMGGVIVGATGNRAKVPTWNVREEMDTDSDRNTKNYKNGKRFGKFEIVTPKVPTASEIKKAKKAGVFLKAGVPVSMYTASIAMAELDSGGFGAFIEKLWEAVKWLLAGTFAELGATVAGALSLSWIPGIGPLLGAAIGAIVGAFIKLFENGDDIVGHKARHLFVYHQTLSYYERKGLLPHHIPVVLDFTDTGHYRVTGGWRLLSP